MELRAHTLWMALALTACGEPADDDGDDLVDGDTLVMATIFPGDAETFEVGDRPYQVLECLEHEGGEACTDVTAQKYRVDGVLCFGTGCDNQGPPDGYWYVLYRW